MLSNLKVCTKIHRHDLFATITDGAMGRPFANVIEGYTIQMSWVTRHGQVFDYTFHRSAREVVYYNESSA